MRQHPSSMNDLRLALAPAAHRRGEDSEDFQVGEFERGEIADRSSTICGIMYLTHTVCDKALFPWVHRHCTPMRGPRAGTGESSGQGSALNTARWWQIQHETACDRAPFSRILPSVIDSIDSGRSSHQVLPSRYASSAAICRRSSAKVLGS
jgi:hypothetical protein